MPILTNTANATISGTDVLFTRSGQGSVRGENVISYIDAVITASEIVTIGIEFKESNVGTNYYKYSTIVSNALTPITCSFSVADKYRLELPIAYCEDGIKLTVSISGTFSTVTIDFNQNTNYN